VRDARLWRNVWLLSLTSFISDVSGEMLQAVLPFLLVSQGASGLGLGLVSGVSEGVGHVFKLVGGYAGERVRRKRILVGAGYLVASLSRFGVAAAATWTVSLGFRSLDRVGKGLRTAPRDTLLADYIPAADRGRAFGLHRAGDTAGAVVGILLAFGALALWGDGVALERQIVYVAAAIGVFSIVPLFFVRESADGSPAPKFPLEPPSRRYASYLGVSGLFYLGHVGYLFFILRAAGPEGGPLSPATAVLWYLGFNVVYLAASYPLGILSDRIGKVRVLSGGFTLAAFAGLLFMLRPSPWTLAGGFLALGLSYAATEATGRALASDLAGTAGRSHRLGWYHMAVGFATLLGGLAAGILWDEYGQFAAFAWSLAMSVLALAALLWWSPQKTIPSRAEPRIDLERPT
jgi:MFS family permease